MTTDRKPDAPPDVLTAEREVEIRGKDAVLCPNEHCGYRKQVAQLLRPSPCGISGHLQFDWIDGGTSPVVYFRDDKPYCRVCYLLAQLETERDAAVRQRDDPGRSEAGTCGLAEAQARIKELEE